MTARERCNPICIPIARSPSLLPTPLRLAPWFVNGLVASEMKGRRGGVHDGMVWWTTLLQLQMLFRVAWNIWHTIVGSDCVVYLLFWRIRNLARLILWAEHELGWFGRRYSYLWGRKLQELRENCRMNIVNWTLFVCFWCDSPQWARASSFTRFLHHTQRRTSR